MKFLDRAKSLKDSEAVKTGGLSLLEDIGNALFGNPLSAAKVLYKGPAFIRDLTFVSKFEAFLMGLDLDEEEMLQLAAKFAEDGNKNDNAVRLVSCLERVDTLKKINCLVNATRCLLASFISMDEYFRICQAIDNTLLEDLMFLREHIDEEDLEYSRVTGKDISDFSKRELERLYNKYANTSFMTFDEYVKQLKEWK